MLAISVHANACRRTWFLQSSRRMYAFSESSKKCSNCTTCLWCSALWILISDVNCGPKVV